MEIEIGWRLFAALVIAVVAIGAIVSERNTRMKGLEDAVDELNRLASGEGDHVGDHNAPVAPIGGRRGR